MTTKVTIDAHAGLPVQVFAIGRTEVAATKHIVQPGSVGNFHVHSGQNLLIVEADVKTRDFATHAASLADIQSYLEDLKDVPGVDLRWLAIARTEIEKAFLALDRAVRDV